MTNDRGRNGNNREIVVWVGLESIILQLLSLVLETVLPPIPCHLMSRSPSKLKFSAMCVLELRRRKSCRRRMAQNKNTDWWQEEKIKENIIKRNHLPEKILLEIQPSWWRGREGTLYFADWTGMDCISKMIAQYT